MITKEHHEIVHEIRVKKELSDELIVQLKEAITTIKAAIK